MPIKVTDNEALPSVLNKWSAEVEQKIRQVEKLAIQGNVGNFTIEQLSRKGMVTSSGLLKPLQNVLPILSGAFTYTSTDASITWNWTGLKLYYPDNETKTLPDGSNTISGLSSSTTYYFYPYFSSLRKQLEWVAGGAGTPPIAYTAKSLTAAQQQNLDQNAPLSGGAVTAITAAPAGSGGGGGGGSECLRAGTLLETKEHGEIPIEQVQEGDQVPCPQGWTSVIANRVSTQEGFVRLWLSDGSVIETSATHPFAVADEDEEYLAAKDLRLSTHILSRKTPLAVVALQYVPVATKCYMLSCEPHHEFYVGDALTHNSLPFK